MISAAVLALSLSGFGLLVFGERMGLGPQLAAFGVIAIFAIATIALALASMTSRLNHYVTASARGAGLRLAALVTVMLLLGLRTRAADAGAVLPAGAVILGFLGARVLVWRTPWRNFLPQGTSMRLDAPDPRDRDPGTGTRGTLAVLALATLLAAALLAVEFFSPTLDVLAAITDWPRPSLALASIIRSGCLILLGGMPALGRAGVFLTAMAVITILFPFAMLALSDGIGKLGVLEIRGMATQALTSAMANARLLATGGLETLGLTLKAEWPSLALGFILGVIAVQPATALPSRAGRFLAMTAGLALALALLIILRANDQMVREIIASQIVALPPSQWPLFVFDETLRGWLAVCGTFPEDAVAAARACGTGHPRTLLPAGAFRFDDGLAAPALALAQGWPITLGFIRGLLPTLLMLAAIALFLHAAACGLGERVLFRTLHPRALRSSRLAAIRLTQLALLIGLYLADRRGVRLDPLMFRWALFGLAGIALVAMIADWLIAAIRFFRARRKAPENPAARPAAAPNGDAALEPSIPK